MEKEKLPLATLHPISGEINSPDNNASNETNLREYSVSELAGSVKRHVETAFPRVRVRGECGRVTCPRSGHVYLDLKDENAVLSAIIWKGKASTLSVQPEEGLEIIAQGRLTTYPGQSRYQLIIEQVELAGVGALMALLEERRKKLLAEGLFDADRKKAIPFLPKIIGVVTSPTGAVIRDILHRLNDRFPRDVLLWPTRVQGDGAAQEIAAAIAGLNALPEKGNIARPDVIIVARGGGSVEDLWCFNEEIVLRSAAESQIPIISAVGHETDTTLLDHLADLRAPTPTGAAELSVPVRTALLAQLSDLSNRMPGALLRRIERERSRYQLAAKSLLPLDSLLLPLAQRVDRAGESLTSGLRQMVSEKRTKFARWSELNPETLSLRKQRAEKDFTSTTKGLSQAGRSLLEKQNLRLSGLAKLLNSLSYKSVLARGFALVRNDKGKMIRDAAQADPGMHLQLQFSKGRLEAQVLEAEEPAKQPSKAKKTSGRNQRLREKNRFKQ